jgi:hypothetical protein
MKDPLHHVMCVRAGDKRDRCHCAVTASSEELYLVLKVKLATQSFKSCYQGVIKEKIKRPLVDQLQAVNFVARQLLGGSASRTLCLNNWSEAPSTTILRLDLEIPERSSSYLWHNNICSRCHEKAAQS